MSLDDEYIKIITSVTAYKSINNGWIAQISVHTAQPNTKKSQHSNLSGRVELMN